MKKQPNRNYERPSESLKNFWLETTLKFWPFWSKIERNESGSRLVDSTMLILVAMVLPMHVAFFNILFRWNQSVYMIVSKNSVCVVICLWIAADRVDSMGWFIKMERAISLKLMSDLMTAGNQLTKGNRKNPTQSWNHRNSNIHKWHNQPHHYSWRMIMEDIKHKSFATSHLCI